MKHATGSDFNQATQLGRHINLALSSFLAVFRCALRRIETVGGYLQLLRYGVMVAGPTATCLAGNFRGCVGTHKNNIKRPYGANAQLNCESPGGRELSDDSLPIRPCALYF